MANCRSIPRKLAFLAIRQNKWTALAVAALLFALISPVACSRSSEKKIEPTYDKNSGKLQLLKYDSKGTGVFDTFSYMDGARVVRVEIDTNGDGKIDRWEYYGPDQKIEKVGFSQANDGKQDAWSYPGPDGKIARIELAVLPARSQRRWSCRLPLHAGSPSGDGWADLRKLRA